jgi:hypothetical protein
VAAIRYHVSWPGTDPYYLANPTDVNTRLGVYGVSGVPAGKDDGWDAGGYSYWMSGVTSRLNEVAHLQIVLGGTYSAPNGTITATVTADSAWTNPASGAKIFFMICENNLSYGGGNWNNVFRKGFPSASGTAFTINANQTKHISQNFTTDGSWNVDNCYIVVFIQRNTSMGNNNIEATNKAAVTTLTPTSVEPATLGTIRSIYR